MPVAVAHRSGSGDISTSRRILQWTSNTCPKNISEPIQSASGNGNVLTTIGTIGTTCNSLRTSDRKFVAQALCMPNCEERHSNCKRNEEIHSSHMNSSQMMRQSFPEVALWTTTTRGGWAYIFLAGIPIL